MVASLLGLEWHRHPLDTRHLQPVSRDSDFFLAPREDYGMRLDRTRSFGAIKGEAYTPAGCDRPAHFDQDGRYFDAQDREILPGQPLASDVASAPLAKDACALRSEQKTANTKERESLLKIVIGMAIGGYKWDPGQARNAATREIVDDILALGLSIDDGTVVKFLRQAAELLPRERTEPSSNGATPDRA